MTGIELIAAERKRQIEVEGWSPQHDDEHVYGELGQAAQAYIHVGVWQSVHGVNDIDFKKVGVSEFPSNWHPSWWKPSNDPIRNLVKAGALIAADIDRLQRKRIQEVVNGEQNADQHQ